MVKQLLWKTSVSMRPSGRLYLLTSRNIDHRTYEKITSNETVHSPVLTCLSVACLALETVNTKVRNEFGPSNQILRPYCLAIFAESRKQLLVYKSGNVSQCDIKFKTEGIYDTLLGIQSCLIEILAIVCV